MQEYEYEVVTVNERREVIQRVLRQSQFFIEPLGKDVFLEMVSIPGGIFLMGSPLRHGYEDEHPQHPVSMAPTCGNGAQMPGMTTILPRQRMELFGNLPRMRLTE